MVPNVYKFIQIINYRDLSLWDIKRLRNKNIASKYKIAKLSDLVIEENTKYSINTPHQVYGILGVNNKGGIFDAYIEKGENIKQKYKRMDNGWLAYNPYRINVGSIGIKTAEHTYNFISPAYVVFRCNSSLLPEFMYLVMKTMSFNNIIRQSTTGSVRQTLKFSSLKQLYIPLPPISEQAILLSNHKAQIKEAEQLEQDVIRIEEDLNEYLTKELGLETNTEEEGQKDKYKYIRFVHFRVIFEWGIDAIQKKKRSESFKYPKMKIKDLCQLGSGGTPSRSCPQYFNGNIPWVKTGEVVNDELLDTEEHITEEAVENSSAKLYPKGSLIIAMYGQGDTRGRTAKLGIEATTNQACAVLYDIDNSIVTTDYLWYYLQGRYDDLRSLASGNNQPNLNAGKIKDYDVVVPPMDVQNEIVTHIREQKALAKQLKQKAKEIRECALKEFENEIFTI